MSDPFERFADECGLRLTAEPLRVAPRDLLAPVDTVEQHFLVSLSRTGTGVDPMHVIFLTPAAGGASPSIRDALWWVAGDAWVIEQSEGRLDRWAATYGYPVENDATARLFEQFARQSSALSRLLGDADLRRLLSI
jgi:hypothetical protein